MKIWAAILIAVIVPAVCLISNAAIAQDDPATVSRISADFAEFLGSQDNADAAVAGLRSSDPFTYTDADGKSVIIDPPTKPMGHGNTFLSLGLAQEQLTQQGIDQPTAAQFEAVMAGGTLVSNATGQPVETEMAGIMQMRSDGAGWGQIAHSMGVKLGHVVSSIKSGHAHPGYVGGSGITSGAGDVDNAATVKGHSKSGKGKSLGHGIVSGSGGEIPTGAGSNGKALGHGIVSGSGQSTIGGAAGSGNGHGKAKGHYK